MRYLFLILVVVAFAFANNDGDFGTSISVDPHGSGSDAITLTIVNDWTLAEKALGLDVFEDGSEVYILGADNNLDVIQAYDQAGGVQSSIPLDAANTNCFGLAWNNDPDTDTYYTNCWSTTNLYYTEDFGASWTTATNPSGNSARGMDFDGTDYWCTNGQGGGVWRFQPGVGQSNIAIPEVTGNPSGLTVFPYGGNLGLAVACYTPLQIYFYEWDGSSMTFIGNAACPASTVSSSYGLAYCEQNGNIYWSYNDGSSYHLAEFSFDLTSLSRSSWGSIKTSF